MQRDDRVYLGHMLDMASKAMARVEGKDRAKFDADEDLRMILAHLLQVIGEAAARVSDVTRRAHPEVPWKKIVDMRHRLVHDYMSVDYDIVWDVTVNRLPGLVKTLRPLVGDHE